MDLKDSARQALVVLTCALLSLAAWWTGGLKAFEYTTVAWRARTFAGPSSPSSRIKLILLDQGSLTWAKDNLALGWPWPRETWATMVSWLGEAGAQTVVLDILFTEPSVYHAGDDQALESALETTGNSVIAAVIGHQTSGTADWPESWWAPGAGDRLGKTAAVGTRAVLPLDRFGNAASLVADAGGVTTEGGMIFHARSGVAFDGRWIPSLGAAPLVLGDPDGYDKRLLSVPGMRVDDDLRVMLRYRAADAYRKFSAAGVLNSALASLEGKKPEIRQTAFNDAVVFVGFSAPGLEDLKPTPVADHLPGVQIHANLYDNLVNKDAIRPVSEVLHAILLLVLCSLVFALLRFFSRAMTGVVVGLAWAAIPFALGFLVYDKGWFLPVTPSVLGCVLAVAAAEGWNYATEGRQKAFIKKAFHHYLSPAVIDRLLDDPSRLRLGGERKELSIFFSDLQGFSSISEGLEPEELTSLLNEYLSAMTDIIHEEEGTVDKYEGDAIIAFWNAPADQPDHALRACRAALRCQEKLEAMQSSLAPRAGRRLAMRIGIHTGPVVVGNMGSRERFDYSVLGDAANLAARLEGANKQFGTFTMVSEVTWRCVSDTLSGRALGRLRVVGRQEPVEVYELRHLKRIDDDGVMKPFREALELWYTGAIEQAEQAFSRLEDKDPAAASYVKRCRELDRPVADTWDGTLNLTEK